jgi:hypothetical protein
MAEHSVPGVLIKDPVAYPEELHIVTLLSFDNHRLNPQVEICLISL